MAVTKINIKDSFLLGLYGHSCTFLVAVTETPLKLHQFLQHKLLFPDSILPHVPGSVLWFKV